jgi:hypothetical protein
MNEDVLALLAWARVACARKDASNPPLSAVYRVRQSFPAEIWRAERAHSDALKEKIKREGHSFRTALGKLCAPIPSLARLVLAAERGEVPGMFDIQGAEKVMKESDRQKKVPKGGRPTSDRGALRDWINGNSFSGFSKKVGVRKIAEKIEAEIIQLRPKGIEQASASTIERIMKGANPIWSQGEKSHSVKVELSQLSQ